MAAAADDGDWQGVENDVTDPEELGVIHAALDSFFQYSRVAHFNSTHLRRQSFYALPQAHWRLLAAPPFSFLETLDRVDEAIDSNAELGRAIATAGIRSFRMQPQSAAANAATDAGMAAAAATTTACVLPVISGPWTGAAKPSDMDKARSTLRQFYRDWSAEGAREREASYGPVKRFLEEERGRVSQRPSSPARAGGGNNIPIAPAIEEDASSPAPPLKVLVPGAGLGRLVFDLCDLGYEVEGNEISYHQLLASAYVLNRAPRAGCHRIYPWIQTFSNHRSRANQLRSYAIPDVHPATRLGTAPARPGGSMSMTAADFLCLYEQDDQLGRFDAVATVFFLDTAPNLVRYLSCIRGCLREGGVLVNVGPLLWHFENSAPGNRGHDDDGDGEHDPAASTGIADPGSFELTEDEVLALVERVGFEIVRRDEDEGLEAPYIQDPDSMLRTVYRPSSWVARKRAGWRGEV
ncbi:hypothetical protein RB597_010377 [Gaeumannomyces tritici]